ncbi:Glycine cleavage system H protein [hydrothermal vent metagenome]|uniref:Glycine cleavage system H protein n=1 Tax=hydrothermal vent metagenome TaxID=652676 RepID=A0A3B1A3B0_9ZZZZ
MSNVPSELRFTKSHEWIRLEDDGSVTIGISDHAQDLLGDLVFVETPEVGATYATGDDCAVVESVKAASDVYSPLSGEITETNEELADAPEVINTDPYGKGWIFKMTLADSGELDGLLDATAYGEQIAAED